MPGVICKTTLKTKQQKIKQKQKKDQKSAKFTPNFRDHENSPGRARLKRPDKGPPPQNIFKMKKKSGATFQKKFLKKVLGKKVFRKKLKIKI